MYDIRETNDFDGLTRLFLNNGLELSERGNEAFKCWEVLDENGERAAGLRLEKRGDEFVIVGIAVEKEHRKQKLGQMLLDAAVAEIKRAGGKRVVLVAKAPEFFRRMGFTELKPGEYGDIIGCDGCGQLNNGCKPEIMGFEIM